MTIYALWCHPRSMSTAVERIMRERCDLDVLHEPFMYDYYIAGRRDAFIGFEPEAGHPTRYADIRDMIRDRARAGDVFFKDMAYYVADTLRGDPEFAGQVRHGFLIRDPAASIVSYQQRQRDFSCEEVGIEAQWRLYTALCEMGHRCQVISAEAVRADPAGEMAAYWAAMGLADAPHALSWDGHVPQGWRSVETWHSEVLQTRQIRPPDPARDPNAELAALGAPYTDFAAHHQPFYEKLLAAAHQK